ncbi:hypothetical protein niasHT_026180 [Heterodera trifolii]|uniref:Large subunit GTPase 1 homolog n=1 Tax=Heterodera trifolii TaxID=157864 RepID=A0ABD2K1Y5_9BILA
MTKRRHKTCELTGFNAGLAKALLNSKARAQTHSTGRGRSARQSVGHTAPQKPLLESKTHESDVQELLTNAELANSTFEAERGDIKLLSGNGNVAISSAKQMDLANSLDQLNADYGHLLRIPRRPRPNTYEDAEHLNALEAEEFVAWRRQLAKLSERNIVITPFERNLEIWRQLWRVVERSHLVVQIVDARNPLLFRSVDLELFVSEVDPKKRSLLLVNKADLLTDDQLRAWKCYFDEQRIDAIFWSAKHRKEETHSKQNSSGFGIKENGSAPSCDSSCSSTSSDENDEFEQEESCAESDEDDGTDETEDEDEQREGRDSAEGEEDNDQFISDPTQLLSILRQAVSEAFPDAIAQGSSQVIGMVGYPNVGKSMTINRLLGTKKTAVSSTPGKTKHFQTLIIDEGLVLCDCPGLVMPQFGISDADMILNGILPIAHMRDYFGPIQLLCERVPRQYFQQRYSVLLPKGIGFLNGHDLLTAVAFLKGFMNASGIPDCSRAARLILADVIDGSLKWVAAPPNVSQRQFDQWTFETIELSKAHQQEQQRQQMAGENVSNKRQIGANLLEQLERRQLLLEGNGGGATVGHRWVRDAVATRLDKTFFTDAIGKKLGTDTAHIQGGIGRMELTMGQGEGRKKKHWNKNKREKLRRICAKNE